MGWAGLCIAIVTGDVFKRVPKNISDAKGMLKNAAASMKAAAVIRGRKMWKKYTGLSQPPSSMSDFRLLKKTLQETMRAEAKSNAGKCVPMMTNDVFVRVPKNISDAKGMLKDAPASMEAAAAKNSRMAWKQYTGLTKPPSSENDFKQVKQKLQEMMTAEPGKFHDLTTLTPNPNPQPQGSA